MKWIAPLALAMLLTPALVAAQESPAVPPAPPGGASSADQQGGPRPDPQRFEAMRRQMEQLHLQSRSQMLGALTPRHRTLVASVIGELAVSSRPDSAVAAQQIDAALSPGERQSVLNIDTAMHATMRNMMQADRAQFEASLTADQRAKMQQHMAQMAAMKQQRPARVQDPGEIVLRTLGRFGGPHPEGRGPM